MIHLRITSSFFFWLAMLVASPIQAQNNVAEDVEKLEKFLRSLDGDYVDPVATNALVEVGIKRMLEELDPHSVYLDPEAYARSNEPLQGKFKGIGIRFIMVDDTMTILDVTPGGAAELAGMRPGDQVIAVNEDTIAGRSLRSSEISQSLKEDEAEAIDMLVQRQYPETEQLALWLRKQDIEINSVPAYFMVDNRTGYIKMERFSSNTLKEFRTALDELNDNRLKHLILDLRGNGGGYLNVAIKVADEFLEDRRLIVYTEGEHQNRRELFATSGGRYTDGELYVLVDANSASASEILAGAIQDWDRGLVIGRRSYGKGLVQRTIEFSDGSAMRMTISRYYTPTGRSIQRSYDKGVDAYRQELRMRAANGELFSEDSIHVIDSLVYYTPKKRKVFGGGGITPDVFIPLDTSLSDDHLYDLKSRALIKGFAFQVYGKEKEKLLADYPSIEQFLDGFSFQDQHRAFEQYVERRGLSLEEDFITTYNDMLERTIKCYLTRFLHGYSAYHQALAYYDADVNAAKEQIARGTVKELGLK